MVRCWRLGGRELETDRHLRRESGDVMDVFWMYVRSRYKRRYNLIITPTKDMPNLDCLN